MEPGTLPPPTTTTLQLQVLAEPQDVAREAAQRIARAAAARRELVLALPTGRTPLPLYDELARLHAQGELDLSRARGFNLDELVLPRDDPRSFRSYMERHAYGRTGLRPERCRLPDGAARDLSAECRRYEQAIGAAGGIDLAVLGVGADGHIAYNLPGPEIAATHVVWLPDALAEAFGVPVAARPLKAVTMGIDTIRAARAILVLATGAAKAEAVRSLVHGPREPRWPCSLLRGHAQLALLADEAAAQRL
jgi:glucosamine-6-phosphate deaminase